MIKCLIIFFLFHRSLAKFKTNFTFSPADENYFKLVLTNSLYNFTGFLSRQLNFVSNPILENKGYSTVCSSVFEVRSGIGVFSLCENYIHGYFVASGDDSKKLAFSVFTSEDLDYFIEEHFLFINTSSSLTTHQRSRRFAPVLMKSLKVEIVHDETMVLHYGKFLNQFVIDLIAMCNSIFHAVNVHLLLVNVSSFDLTSDTAYRLPLNLSVIENWNLKNPHSDHVVLYLTRMHFSDILGSSFSASMCSNHSVAGISCHNNMYSVALIVVHELGHILGLDHDCECEFKNCFMKKSISDTNYEKGDFSWSRCSIRNLSKLLPNYKCLKSINLELDICGDGVIANDEQCDNNFDHCCNSSSCRFVKGAKCLSLDGCCNAACQLSPSPTVCREAANECDLPEFCSGSESMCPPDVFVEDGTPCNLGHCFEGECKSNTLACEKKNLEYLPEICPVEDCKTIACYRNHSCLFYSGETDGLSCSANSICVNGKCLENTGSVCNCNSRGVCNSNGRCHCDNDWAPPDCSAAGRGGSYDSNHSQRPINDSTSTLNGVVFLFVFIFLVMVIILAVLIYYFKFYKKKPFTAKVQHHISKPRKVRVIEKEDISAPIFKESTNNQTTIDLKDVERIRTCLILNEKRLRAMQSLPLKKTRPAPKPPSRPPIPANPPCSISLKTLPSTRRTSTV